MLDRVYTVIEVSILVAQFGYMAWLFRRMRVMRAVSQHWGCQQERTRLGVLAWWRLHKWKRAEGHCREMAAQIYQLHEELRLWQAHVIARCHRDRQYLTWLRKKKKSGRKG